MLYGSVALGLKNGANAEVDWAARAEMFKSTDDEKYRMKFYQVYLVGQLFCRDTNTNLR